MQIESKEAQAPAIFNFQFSIFNFQFFALLLAIGCAPAASPKPPLANSAVQQASVAEPLPSHAIEQPVETKAAEPVVPQQVYRPDDQRPSYHDEQLAALGIRRYESKRLRLYTDIPAEQARVLPVVIDRAYDALSEYFGPLPPARDGSEFQMTGCLLRDEQAFRESGLIPGDLPPFEHGRHRRNEFWMRDQQYDYYRRHLLIHEVTHCVTTYLPDTHAPVWYLEGMAEVFGTHRLTADGSFEWGLMPDTPENFAGMGRITLVRQDVAKGKAKSMAQVTALRADDYFEPGPYAWSWALCHFLTRHPRYSVRIRELGRHLQGSQFAAALTERFQKDVRDLETEWVLFATNLQYGYDLPRSAIDFQAGTPLAEGEGREAIVQADRGWQSARVTLQAGAEYELAATGQFTLADLPKPWVSEPQGVSIRYFHGRPLGELQGCLRNENALPDEQQSMRNVFPIGRGKQWTAPITGTLYLRLNDSWSELGDNRGEVRVIVNRGSGR